MKYLLLIILTITSLNIQAGSARDRIHDCKIQAINAGMVMVTRQFSNKPNALTTKEAELAKTPKTETETRFLIEKAWLYPIDKNVWFVIDSFQLLTLNICIAGL